MLETIFHIFPSCQKQFQEMTFSPLVLFYWKSLPVTATVTPGKTMHGECSTNKVIASACNALAILLAVFVGDRACKHLQSVAVFKVTRVTKP